jgi:hypothetical protein
MLKGSGSLRAYLTWSTVRMGTVIVRAGAAADGKRTCAVVLAEISSGDRLGCFRAGTTAKSEKPKREPTLQPRSFTARLARAATIGNVTTVEAAQCCAGSLGSLDGSEGSIACSHETVMATLGAIGTTNASPDACAESTLTPAGGAYVSLTVVPVNSALTATSWVATSAAGAPRSSLVSLTASVLSGAQAGTVWAAAEAAHASSPTARAIAAAAGARDRLIGRHRDPSGATYRLPAGGVGLAAIAVRPHNPCMTDDAVLKDELRSAIEARKELGDEMEPAVIDAFVERIEGRLAGRLADEADRSERALQRRREHQKEMVLGSMAISIPLLAIAAVFTGVQGVIVVCVALAVIAIVSSRG